MDTSESPWEDDSPWGDNPKSIQDSEWSKISSDFQNAGYREGITAGKESHLQQGFDEGFAQTGAPLGREIGLLRGAASAILSLLTSKNPLPGLTSDSNRDALVQEARYINSELSEIRFSDVVPPDLEAIAHAREHLEAANEDDRSMDIELGEEVESKRKMESLEDAMAKMGAGSITAEVKKGRPKPDDVVRLRGRLTQLSEKLGVPLGLL
ncbi:hypothetical protein BXZ70DRAFT_1000979 [Cristinia sonorae]|uniref:Protein YAE1 n=1 Tax=Cristinia sonorae TaxID=1940300 RepID=A0A8K0UM38_9AGAR|nr:hypothetical protein BXZ70DRAFT_1000979 [Cristinia sonorae]